MCFQRGILLCFHKVIAGYFSQDLKKIRNFCAFSEDDLPVVIKDYQ